jgi:hypothetical protein
LCYTRETNATERNLAQPIAESSTSAIQGQCDDSGQKCNEAQLNMTCPNKKGKEQAALFP